ncbi:MAG: LuxR C-terminal-related transcriptional regulator [Pseudomonadota bacterium]
MQSGLLDLIGDIYEASYRPKEWPVFFEKLCQTMDAFGGALFVEDHHNRERYILAGYGLPIAYKAAFRLGLAKHDYPYQAQKDQPEGMARQIVDHREMRESHPTYYRLLLSPNQCGFIAGMNVINDDEWMIGIAFQRRMDKPPFSRREIEFLQQLHPHLKRAIRIHKEFARLRQQKQSLEETLSKLTLGVVLVDPAGNVQYANPVANSICRQHGGLALKDSGLICAHRADQQAALLQAIDRAATSRAGTLQSGRQALGFDHPDQAHPLSAIVATATADTMPLAFTQPGGAVLYLSSSRVENNLTSEALEQIYRLTPTEANVAIGLTNGLSVQQIAGQLSRQPETVRTHLKRVFQKTGTHKQHELVTLLLGSAFASVQK